VNTAVPAQLAQQVSRLCPEQEPSFVDEFLLRMGSEYAASEAAENIARHVQMAASLGESRRGAVSVLPRPDGRSEVVFVAYDYFAEFSILCGLLAAHGLFIEAGRIHTFAPPAPEPPRRRRPIRGPVLPSRKIVDVFRVVPRDPAQAPGASALAAALEQELQGLLGLLAENRTDEARESLNRRMVALLARGETPFAGALFPIEIQFENEASSVWTLMRVRGPDTPAFLYSLSNALAMRRIYVHGVHIASEGSEVRDEFQIGRAGGGRLEGAEEQHTLRLAVVLIKQFTHFLPWAPDPARALLHFDQFLDRVMAAGAGSEALHLLQGPEGFQLLARLLGSSDFLWEDFLRVHFEHLAPVLGEWKSRPLERGPALRRRLRAQLGSARGLAERVRALNDFKDEEMLLVDMKRLLDPAVSLEEFSGALTDLAEVVLEEAFDLSREPLAAEHGRPRLADGAECAVALLGLGKFGGRELGYASDLELLVVYAGAGATDTSGIENGQFFERVVQGLSAAIQSRQEGIFHVDLRLRPYGNKGPLATPLASLEEYYRPGGAAHPFERQALIKLRHVGGDPALGAAVEAFRDAYVWSAEPWDLAAALHLRNRQVRELVPPGRFNVKYSPGGLVEIEYAAQYLQILNGRQRPELRTPSTLEALDRLQQAGLLSASEHQLFAEAYVFWRQVADALRMVRGNARDLLLPEEASTEFAFLARRLGYGGADWAAGASALARDVRRHRDGVAALFARRFRA
jgi:glutamate-ammonia-ligase adenylyltransferase